MKIKTILNGFQTKKEKENQSPEKKKRFFFIKTEILKIALIQKIFRNSPNHLFQETSPEIKVSPSKQLLILKVLEIKK